MKREGWLDDPNEYECPVCGTTDIRISGYGGIGVGVKCSDPQCDGWLEESSILGIDWDADGVVFDEIPDKWAVGETAPIRYQCPECDSYEIKRTNYDDGCGYYDVNVQCEDCGASTWE